MRKTAGRSTKSGGFAFGVLLFRGDQFHFDFGSGRKGGDLNTGACRGLGRKTRGIDAVDCGKVRKVGQKHSGLNDVAEIHAGSGKDAFQIGQNLLGLCFDGIAGQLSGSGIQPDLSGGKQQIAAGYRVRVRAKSGGRIGGGNDVFHNDTSFEWIDMIIKSKKNKRNSSKQFFHTDQLHVLDSVEAAGDYAQLGISKSFV